MLKELIVSAQKAVESSETLDDLQQVRVQYLGKSGFITEEMKKLGQLAPEDRKEIGQKVNKAKEEILQFFQKHFFFW